MGTVLIAPPAWTETAACAEADPEDFFSNADDRARLAVSICRSCPVAVPCLTHAIETDERYGIWGGRTPEQRAGTSLLCITCGGPILRLGRRGRPPVRCGDCNRRLANERSNDAHRRARQRTQEGVA